MSVRKSTKLALALGLFLVLALGLSITAFAAAPVNGSDDILLAQARRFGGPEMEKFLLAQFDSMCVFVGMNAKQKTEAKKLYDTMTAERTKLFAQMQGGGDFSAIREPMTKIREDYNTKLEALLNADQKAKLVKWNEMHPRRGGGGRRG